MGHESLSTVQLFSETEVPGVASSAQESEVVVVSDLPFCRASSGFFRDKSLAGMYLHFCGVQFVASVVQSFWKACVASWKPPTVPLSRKKAVKS